MLNLLPSKVWASSLILVAIVLGGLYSRANLSQRYVLTNSEQKLLSKSTVNHKKIKVNNNEVSYNRQEENSASPSQELILTANAEDSTGKVPYQATLPLNPNEGINFSDSKGQLNLKLIPEHNLSKGKYEGGRVIYPASAQERHVYTLKRNGLKEDILLSQKPKAQSLKFQWRLETGEELEAKLLADGSVGFYSANPYLFGDVSIGDEKSQQLVDNARKNGKKEYLAFVIPVPYMTDVNGKKNFEDVSFKLENNQLILEAKNLHNQTYPLSIDPTVVVTTTSEFRQGQDDGMIDYGTSGQINRASMNYGDVSSFSTSYFTTPRYDHDAAVYKGFLYIAGGNQPSVDGACKSGGSPSSNLCNDIQRYPINADGSLGTAATTQYFSIPRAGLTISAYNGFLYIAGGTQSNTNQDCVNTGSNSAYCNDIQRYPINSDGSLATIAGTQYFATPRAYHTATAYNGYFYITGGYNGSDFNDIQRYPINADGSLGSVAGTQTFTTARRGHTATAYNGYLYITGGLIVSGPECKNSGSSTYCNDIQRYPINADGSLGTAAATQYFSIPRYGHMVTAYNGYLYVSGGLQANSNQDCVNTGSNTSYCNDIQRYPINADGSLGSVASTQYFATPRFGHLAVVYDSYVYLIGGNQPNSDTACKNSGTSNICNDIQRATLGVLATAQPATTNSTGFTNARGQHTSVIHNGFLYIVGGYHATNFTNYNDIQYCQISTSGSVGSCTVQAAAFTQVRYDHTSVAYNGFLYIIGGTSTSNGSFNDITYCPFNLNGSVGTCTRQLNAFTTANYNHSSVAYNGYLYIIGGSGTGSGALLEYCPFNTNGSVGACTQQANAFTTGRASHTSVVNNGYLYIIGGTNGTAQNDIQYGLINSNGSISCPGSCPGSTVFSQQTNAFTTGRTDHTSVVSNGYLYIIGGYGGGARSDIQYCPLNSNGSVGTCVQQANGLPAARERQTSVVYNGYIYTVGGAGTGGMLTDIIYQGITGGKLNLVGTKTQQVDVFSAFGARDSHASVVYNGYLYIIAGYNGTARLTDIIYCPINSDATIGTCFQQTSKVLLRSLHAATAYNGYLYIAGGYSGTLRYNDVYYCPISSDGSTGTCTRQDNAFPLIRSGLGMATYNGYMYVMGGEATVGGYQSDINYATINSNGSLSCPTSCGVGNVFAATTGFTGARIEFGTAVNKGYLYIAGGYDGTRHRTDIQYCALNGNGTVASCTQRDGVFNGQRNEVAMTVYDDYLYLVGGANATFAYDDVVSCKINTNGSVGACEQQDAILTTTTTNHSVVAYSGYIYSIGGLAGGVRIDDVDYFPIIGRGFGTVGTFTGNSQYFATPRASHAAVAYNGYLYIAGGNIAASSTDCKSVGSSSSDLCNDIQRYPINSDGSLGTLAGTQYFVTPRYGLTATAYNGYLYIAGGNIGSSSGLCKSSGSSQYCTDIQRYPMNTDGSLGALVATQHFSTARYGHTATAYKGYYYIAGGYTGSLQDDIQRYPINADGSLGSIAGTQNFTTARYGHTAIAYNGYFYIVGGGLASAATTCKNEGSSYVCNDIQRYPINGDGSLGSLAGTQYFATPRYFHAASAYNGYLYIVGGSTLANGIWCQSNVYQTTSCNDILKYPINTDGSLGALASTQYFTLPPRNSLTATPYNGYLYIAGGAMISDITCKNSGSSGYCNEIMRASISTPSDKSNYERVIDTSNGLIVDSISFSGSAVCGAELQYRVAGSNGQFGSVTTIPFALPGTTYSINQSAKYIWTKVVLKDEYCGTNSNVTDITVTYTKTTAPTLITPTAGGISVPLLAQFQLRSADGASDYLRYEIVLYDATCTTEQTGLGSPFTQPTGTPQTGWTGQDAQSSTAYASNPVVTSSTIATYTAQSALTPGTVYCWKARARDPGGTNTWSNYSATQTFTTNAAPNAPTLILPTNGATAVSRTPEFRLKTTDVDSDYVKYRFIICNTNNTSNCVWGGSGSFVLRSIDQTSSQTNWASQSQSSGTAYTSGQTAVYNYTFTDLAANTTYYWRAYAIDPGGANTWSSASSISSFTTVTSATPREVRVRGGVNIGGGVVINP